MYKSSMSLEGWQWRESLLIWKPSLYNIESPSYCSLNWSWISMLPSPVARNWEQSPQTYLMPHIRKSVDVTWSEDPRFWLQEQNVIMHVPLSSMALSSWFPAEDGPWYWISQLASLRHQECPIVAAIDQDESVQALIAALYSQNWYSELGWKYWIKIIQIC